MPYPGVWIVVMAKVSTVVSGIVVEALSNTKEYPAKPEPPTSVELNQVIVIGRLEIIVLVACEEIRPVGIVGGTKSTPGIREKVAAIV